MYLHILHIVFVLNTYKHTAFAAKGNRANIVSRCVLSFYYHALSCKPLSCLVSIPLSFGTRLSHIQYVVMCGFMYGKQQFVVGY